MSKATKTIATSTRLPKDLPCLSSFRLGARRRVPVAQKVETVEKKEEEMHKWLNKFLDDGYR